MHWGALLLAVLPCLCTVLATPRQLELVWEEQFDGPVLNSSRWTVQHNFTHCCPDEPQLYVQDDVFLQDGMLVIRTQRRTAVDATGKLRNFTSGWIDSRGKFSATFGRWVVRAKLPSPQATGAWPAHWMMPEPATSHPPDVCWPVGGEIDIMEATSNPLLNRVFGSFRWGTECGDNKQELPGGMFPPLLSPGVDFSTDFHEFGVDWNATTLQFHVDGQPYHTRTSDQANLPTDPFYWILNTAIAWYFPPGAGAQFPAHHYIDWVRVYQ